MADGIAFSCGNTRIEQPSMRYMFDEIERTLGKKYTRDPDLTRWSNQGILLLNTALTTTVNKVGTHYLIWQPFLAFIFDILSFEKSDLIFVFLGSKAKLWAESVPENSIKIFCVHPAAAAHNNLESWESGDLFNKISEYCRKDGKEITW